MTLAALLAALGRPSWWLLALAGFLVRGGVLLFILVIVRAPSPLVISNVVAPLVVPLALGQVDAGTVAPIALAFVIALAWLLAGAWLAAATETVLIREARAAAADAGLPVGPPVRPGRRLVAQVAVAHLAAHLPLAVALGFGSVQIGNVAYAELTHPFEVATPLVVRVAAGAIPPLATIVLAWLAGEVVGGLAARRIVLAGASIGGGLRDAIGDIVRRPAATLLPAVGLAAALAIDVAAVLAAVAFVWTQARARLLEPASDGWTVPIGLLAFGGVWVGALVLTGLVDAWRSAAMTVGVERAAVERAIRAGRDPDHGRTFGASPGRRPGDWPNGDEGDSLYGSGPGT